MQLPKGHHDHEWPLYLSSDISAVTHVLSDLWGKTPLFTMFAFWKLHPRIKVVLPTVETILDSCDVWKHQPSLAHHRNHLNHLNPSWLLWVPVRRWFSLSHKCGLMQGWKCKVNHGQESFKFRKFQNLIFVYEASVYWYMSWELVSFDPLSKLPDIAVRNTSHNTIRTNKVYGAETFTNIEKPWNWLSVLMPASARVEQLEWSKRQRASLQKKNGRLAVTPGQKPQPWPHSWKLNLFFYTSLSVMSWLWRKGSGCSQKSNYEIKSHSWKQQ